MWSDLPGAPNLTWQGFGPSVLLAMRLFVIFSGFLAAVFDMSEAGLCC